MQDKYSYGGFTLPGEAGYEELTLKLAKRWGADVIRDSDGTQLSDQIFESGYDIYSTICLVRADNEWAKANMDKLQQCYLMSEPVVAEGDTVTINLMDTFYKEQFKVNFDDDPKEFWQVFDRTTNEEVALENWTYDAENGTVTVSGTQKWHRYTVNFLAYRIWEEISMYNHHTNNWGDREHLMPIDPIYPEAQEHLLKVLEQWLKDHEHTKVVRFTSLFYNFFWIWGADPKRPFHVNDWGSYAFAVSAYAIREFEKKYGYRLTSEDFVTNGLYNNSYMPPSDKYRDWMEFIHNFVVDFGKKCVALVQKYDKKAYVFYNDHWLGMEPTLERWKEFNFDGIIEGIFNGFESRRVSATPHVKVRELRLHPYFFPTGVNGAPSFIEGGNPTLELKTYWMDIRRAILRAKIDRIGFGGYLHLVENHPDFIQYVEDMAREFRMIKDMHQDDQPYTADFTVAFLTAWGHMREWGCRGHFNRGNFYNEVMESISGLPVNVKFISFADIVENGIPEDIDVIINAGAVNDAWSGGWHWQNPAVIERITEFVSEGGGFIGVGEPSALDHSIQYFQLAHLLGVDRETSLTNPFERYRYETVDQHFITAGLDPEKIDFGKFIDEIFVLGPETKVLAERSGSPLITEREFGKGRVIYLAGHKYNPENVRLLHRALCYAAGKEDEFGSWVSSNIHTECAYYPNHSMLVVVNNSFEPQTTTITTADGKEIEVKLEANSSKFIEL
ncbi:MAG: 1,3-beta-galactosyl-N-acetylhexosamine phosphorylase [Candidatus Wallacebacter cryptica]|jgi:beta-D-galactosyl-(1->4)-L-rhamnose phosphorylase|nr:1,3-beta-galactosyl-N-acetylhexosamine phosphorylase [Bacillota bacterium]